MKIPSHPADNRTVYDIGEFGLIEEIRKLLPRRLPPGVMLGLGDDAAVIHIDTSLAQLVTCDMLVENRHFRLDWTSAEQLGRRAIAVNQSDIAAMGGNPLYALVSLALPPHLNIDFFRDLIAGMRDQMAEFEGGIIGGNLSGSDAGLTIDVSMLGSAPLGKYVTRSGARPGDRLFLTGAAGMGAGGLSALKAYGGEAKDKYFDLVQAFLVPQPRIPAGQLLAASGYVTAMIDVSDGISGDVGHLCDSSRAGVEIDLEKLPIPPSVVTLAQELSLDAQMTALHGGDSYELLFTVRPETPESCLHQLRGQCRLPLTEIGRILTKEEGCFTLKKGKVKEELQRRSWDHFK